MSVRNFIPTVWSSVIDKQLDEYLIAADFCNRKYEGDVQQAGDQVRVQQALRPTISTTSDGNTHIDMSNPENIDGTSLTLTLNYQSYYNYTIYDVDKAQAKGELKNTLAQEVTQGLANEADKVILAQAASKAVTKSASTQITAVNVLSMINAGFQQLWQNNVPLNSELEIAITPAFHSVFLEAYEKLDTNNHDMLRKGIVGLYNNAVVKMSNNIYNDGTDDYITIRARNAIAFAKPITITDAIRNPNGLGDVLRGEIVYGAKVMRPKEIYVIKAHY